VHRGYVAAGGGAGPGPAKGSNITFGLTFLITRERVSAAAFGICCRSIFILTLAVAPIAALGVIQAPKDEPGSLPGIANASFGIGGSIGFAWAGTVVAQGTTAGFESALWICVAIGVAALATSIILKPRPLVAQPDSIPQLAH
jgi:hypothetical protein